MSRSWRVTLLLVAVGAVILVIWIGPVVATWVIMGRWPSLTVAKAVAAVVRQLPGSRPGSIGYPRLIRSALTDRAWWWVLQAVVVAIESSVACGVWLWFDARASRPGADRRWWQLSGVRPRVFARPHTVRGLLAGNPSADRLVVGYYGGRLLTVRPNVQTLVIAATQQGKTSGVVVPAISEHMGPVVTTSIRSDIVTVTAERRREHGRVFVWDPYGPFTHTWDPLQGCEDWGHALMVARWLTSSADLNGASTNQDYFDREGQGLLGPLLHAAALSDGQVSITGVYRWALRGEKDEPIHWLKQVSNADAIDRINAVYGYAPQQRDGIIATSKVVLSAYEHPAAERASRPGGEIIPARVFAPGEQNTLYIVADRERQVDLKPLVVALLSSLLHHTSKLDNEYRSLPVPALFAIDEAANIAPVKQLPEILETSLPSARFLTIWHSVAQMHRAFGSERAAEILASSQAKIFLGSITDEYTSQLLSGLLGQRAAEVGNAHPEPFVKLALQRMRAGEGLLLHTHEPAVLFKQRYYFRDRAFADVAEAERAARNRSVSDGQPSAGVSGRS